jgi:hypothetical protein
MGLWREPNRGRVRCKKSKILLERHLVETTAVFCAQKGAKLSAVVGHLPRTEAESW